MSRFFHPLSGGVAGVGELWYAQTKNCGERENGMDVALWILGGVILLAAAAVGWAVVGKAKKAKVVVTTRFQRVGAFVFRRRDGSDRLQMRACTGWVKRRLFREETGQLTFRRSGPAGRRAGVAPPGPGAPCRDGYPGGGDHLSSPVDLPEGQRTVYVVLVRGEKMEFRLAIWPPA